MSTCKFKTLRYIFIIHVCTCLLYVLLCTQCMQWWVLTPISCRFSVEKRFGRSEYYRTTANCIVRYFVNNRTVFQCLGLMENESWKFQKSNIYRYIKLWYWDDWIILYNAENNIPEPVRTKDELLLVYWPESTPQHGATCMIFQQVISLATLVWYSEGFIVDMKKKCFL